MQKKFFIALSLLLSTVFFKIVKTNYVGCPFAEVQDAYHRSESAPSVSIAIADSESVQGQNTPISPAYTFSSLINGYLNGAGEPYLSENAILKTHLSENTKCASPPETCTDDATNYYYRSVDGSCNNLRNPGLGMSNSGYGRLLPPNYQSLKHPGASKYGTRLPSAREISLLLFGDDLVDDKQVSLASMQWGQVVSHDLSKVLTSDTTGNCCEIKNIEKCYPIELVPNGPIALGTNKRCLEFSRGLTDKDLNCQKNPYYAEKISSVTPFVDMSSIYGSNKKESDNVRLFRGGLLKTSRYNNRPFLPFSDNPDGQCGKHNKECYSIPDDRNHFIPSITAIQIILTREHNNNAYELSKLNSHYSDEKLFQEAKKISIAKYQAITYNEWLPVQLGTSYVYANGLIRNVGIDEYVNDYDDTLDPATYVESAAAALRYCHNQAPGYFSLINPNSYINETKRLSDFFQNTKFLLHGNNFDALLLGLALQPQKEADNNIDKELKHYFNRKPHEKFGGDLKSIDINRGRDMGLPSYNDARAYCGLARAYDWLDFASEISLEKIQEMQKLYGSVDDVDLDVGADLEAHVPYSLFGPTNQCIVLKQFLNSRRSDRFFFENENLFSGFTREQLAEIRKASLAGLICDNSDYIQAIQPNVFIVPNPSNAIRSCKYIPRVDLRKWKAIPQQPLY